MVYRSFNTWIIALLGAIALNIVLFALMPGLIQRMPRRSRDMEDLHQVQVVRIKKAETPARKKREDKLPPPKPVKQQIRKLQQPLRQNIPASKPKLAFELNTRLPAAQFDFLLPQMESFSMDLKGMKPFYSVDELDSGLTPIIQIPAIYPIRAKRRGIEGYVKIEFTVTRTGHVSDIQVIEAKPEGIFETSVLSSVSRWKFKPGTVEGVAVDTKVETTMRFELER